MVRLLTDDEVTTQLADLDGWERAPGDDPAIRRSIHCAGFRGSLDLVQRVGDLAEEMDHHPDIDIRWDTVTLTLSTHSAGGLTQLDIEAAHRINQVAAGG